MPVVTLFGGAYCHRDEISKLASQRFQYELVGRDILEGASKRFKVPYDRLLRSMHGPIPFWNNVTHERERNIEYIKAVFADKLRDDNFVYKGFASHLIPRNLNHILRVCVVANRDYRIKQVVDREGLPPKAAARHIEIEDQRMCRWTQYLFDRGPWDNRLYDIKIPTHTMSPDEAVDLIGEYVQKETLQPTDSTRQAVDDFVLQCAVSVALVEKGYTTEVVCVNGDVSVQINKFTLRLNRMKEKIEKLVRSIPGVRNVEVGMGPEFDRPRISPDDFELPPKVLLVDDEKEFVLTLSERLRIRNIPSHVVYNGEEALSFVKDDEPDVIVLDLMMPGIKGVDVLRRLKREHPKLEVIILTGHGSDKDEMLTRELGAFAYLQKPVDIDKLAQTMKAAYDKIQKNT